MTLPLYKEDLIDFFQRSNEPYIFPYKEKGEVCLDNYEPVPGNQKQSIRAIKGVMNALIHLKLNLITPSQVAFSYVIRKKNVWGLRHAVCQRGEQIQKGDDCYNPQQFKYHQNAQNQLMWNVGKIWLRFFTRAPVRIKYQNQEKINQIINQNVKDQTINTLIQKLLIWKPRKRISFQQFLSEDIFIQQQEQEQKSFFTSILGHIKTVSSIHLLQSKVGVSELDMSNAYVKEIRYRSFLEYLEVDLYFQQLKTELFKEFNVGNQSQKANCQFTRYMISLQNYFNLARLNTERVQIGQRIEELQHRLYYTRFSKRMVQVRDDIDKKAKRLRNNPHLKEQFKIYLKSLDDLNKDDVYEQFKSCLSEYAQSLNDDLRKDDKDILALKLLVKIYIIRTSSYVFSQMRTQVFEPFISKQGFNIKRVLSRINQCQQRNLLKQLLVNIKHFYFKQ